MKKLFTLVSLLTCLGFGGLVSSSSPVNIPGVEKDGEKTYIVTIDKDVKSKKAAQARNKVLNEIAYHLPEEAYEIGHIYDAVLNGFSITMDSSLESFVSSIPGVASIEVAHEYARPTADEGGEGAASDGEAVDSQIKADKLANYSAETMSAQSADITNAIKDRVGADGAAPQLGKGITIGIIDTGLFLNQVDGTTTRTNAEEDAVDGGYTLNAPAFVDNANVQDVLTSEAVATAKRNASFVGQNAIRINKKIAYAYDYQGNDPDVNPTTAEHGTHVASLAAANGTDFQGIAPNAQLAIMKVFPDGDGGAIDDDIIAAINDAALLHLDVINLSLGNDLTDFDDNPSNATHKAIQDCIDNGVIVNYAAGNAGKSSFSGNQGYSDWTTDTVESSYLGGETLDDEQVNVVASSNPDRAFYETILQVNGVAVSYDDQVVNREGSDIEFNNQHPFTELLPEGQNEATFKYVRIGGLGTPNDYQAFYDAYNAEHGTSITSLDQLKTDPSDTSTEKIIAVVNRGETTFTEKVTAAQNANADALIVINNDASVTFNFRFDFASWNPSIPTVLVFQNMGYAFGDVNTVGELTLAQNRAVDAPDGNITSSYSSDGPAYNLDFSPTISAPGSNVIGAIDAAVTGETSKLMGYDNLSGTSMASPNFTGALASVLSEMKPENGGQLALADDSAFTNYKKIISNIAMSTANQLNDSSGDSVGAVRLQGAGVVNVADMIGNNAYVTTGSVPDSEATFGADAIKRDATQVSKVELKNRGSLFTDLTQDEEAYIEFPYTIHNETSVGKTYTPSISVMIPSLRIQLTTSEYKNSLENDQSTVQDVADNLPGTITTSINDDALKVPDDNWEDGKGEITVAANSTVSGTVKVRIDNLHVEKVFDSDSDEDGKKDVEDFSGTLREYFNKFLSNAGGGYVEGYFYLTETGSEINAENDNGVSHTLTLPYMGFYGDYTKGDAVEPFQFEKEEGRLYNSEMADAYIQNLSGDAARRNAYTGSTLTATGSEPTASELSRIGGLTSSAYQDGSKYLAINRVDEETGKTYLKAGAPGVSDHIVNLFYVNRSISSATWSITGNGVNKEGEIGDLFNWSSGWAVGTAAMGISGIAKSLFVPSTTTYEMHHGYACIDLSDLDEGEYTLTYSFTKKGTGTPQEKSYRLVIDKTAPTLVSTQLQTTEEGRTQLVVTSKGGDYSVRYSGRTATPEAVAGEDDLYRATLTLTEAMLENNTFNFVVRDTSYNDIQCTVHLKSMDVIVSGSDVPADSDFTLTPVSTANNNYIYDLVVTDDTGADLTNFNGTARVSAFVGIGLDSNSLSVSVNGETLTSGYSYDSASGYLTIDAVKFEEGYASLSLNKQIASPSAAPVVENPSEGLQAWQIALIVVGAVVVVGLIAFLVIFFMKKKKAVSSK